MDEEHDLLQRTRSGDRRALDSLVARHLPALRAFVSLRLGGLPTARESESDIVQSVCVELLRALPEFEYRGEGQFRLWLYTAALHKLNQRHKFHAAQQRDARREVGLQPNTGEDEEKLACYASFSSPSRVAMAREEVARIEAAFVQLPEHYREVITLARIVGLSQEELAQATGRSVASSRNLLHRALVRLAGLLDDGS